MAKKEKNEVVDEKEQATVPSPEVPPVISVADIQSMIGIVDLASERGAFRGGELSPVGNLRDKLVNFVKWVAKGKKNEKGSE